MGGVDKARVAAVIEAASRGSKYYANAQARERQLSERVVAMKASVGNLPASALGALQRKMDAFCAREEGRRALCSVVVHVDFDAFFAACAELGNDSLRGKPL